jgi:DNA replication protein DnaC
MSDGTAATMDDLLRWRRFFLAHAGVPTAYWQHRLATFEPQDSWQRKALRQAREFVERLEDHYVTDARSTEHYPADLATVGRGLAFVGPPGTGKTHLAAATLLDAYTQRGVKIAWRNFSQMMADKIAMMRLGETRSDWAIEEQWQMVARQEDAENAAVLVLDDIGQEQQGRTGWSKIEFARIIRGRHASCKPTIITTNHVTAEWADTLGEATASFMREAFVVIPLIGKDQRRRGEE